mmetsp:Transcript_3983/g.11941  ORF Transcript_3983/g.11941 Transcript_3983/m.11941 type:complete len:443 (+) Transcript_3983:1638-2966(+)
MCTRGQARTLCFLQRQEGRLILVLIAGLSVEKVVVGHAIVFLEALEGRWIRVRPIDAKLHRVHRLRHEARKQEGPGKDGRRTVRLLREGVEVHRLRKCSPVVELLALQRRVGRHVLAHLVRGGQLDFSGEHRCNPARLHFSDRSDAARDPHEPDEAHVGLVGMKRPFVQVEAVRGSLVQDALLQGVGQVRQFAPVTSAIEDHVRLDDRVVRKDKAVRAGLHRQRFLDDPSGPYVLQVSLRQHDAKLHDVVLESFISLDIAEIFAELLQHLHVGNVHQGFRKRAHEPHVHPLVDDGVRGVSLDQFRDHEARRPAAEDNRLGTPCGTGRSEVCAGDSTSENDDGLVAHRCAPDLHRVDDLALVVVSVRKRDLVRGGEHPACDDDSVEAFAPVPAGAQVDDEHLERAALFSHRRDPVSQFELAAKLRVVHALFKVGGILRCGHVC